MTTLTNRAVEFISDRDPFGDYFSEHDLMVIKAMPNSIRAFLEYGTHRPDCRGGDGERCTCGYLDLWSKYIELEPMSRKPHSGR